MSRPKAAKVVHRARKADSADDSVKRPRTWSTTISLAIALLGISVWAYWHTLTGLWSEWNHDANYSAGKFIPLAAILILIEQRHRLDGCRPSPSWWGFLLLVPAALGQFFGLVFLYESAERYAFVLTIAGVVLLVAGWRVFWRLRWILAFLLLMVPLPGKVHNLISGPLQDFSTASTLFVLEVFGSEVSRSGNVLTFGPDNSVGVAEACSGLRMLTAFVAVSAAFALVVSRPSWQKTVLVLTSVPIAIVCNVVRLVATATLYAVADNETAERFFHDFAGVTMMPLAVALLLVELWLLQVLVVDDSPRTDAEHLKTPVSRENAVHPKKNRISATR